MSILGIIVAVYGVGLVIYIIARAFDHWDLNR